MILEELEHNDCHKLQNLNPGPDNIIPPQGWQSLVGKSLKSGMEECKIDGDNP
jgi:hypothetical protein